MDAGVALLTEIGTVDGTMTGRGTVTGKGIVTMIEIVIEMAGEAGNGEEDRISGRGMEEKVAGTDIEIVIEAGLVLR